MSVSLMRTVSHLCLLAYGVALALEAWRPGFVTYFWNPQLFLLGALAATAFSLRDESVSVSRIWKVVFWIVFAIVVLNILWQAFPPSMTRWLVMAGTVLLLISMARAQLFIIRKNS